MNPTNPPTNSTIHLLNEARHEITSLRRRNEILNAKVEVMELFACVLHTQPATRDQGMTVDIAWQLEKEAERLTEIHTAPATVMPAMREWAKKKGLVVK